jgi:hypothetical protein
LKCNQDLIEINTESLEVIPIDIITKEKRNDFAGKKLQLNCKEIKQVMEVFHKNTRIKQELKIENLIIVNGLSINRHSKDICKQFFSAAKNLDKVGVVFSVPIKVVCEVLETINKDITYLSVIAYQADNKEQTELSEYFMKFNKLKYLSYNDNVQATNRIEIIGVINILIQSGFNFDLPLFSQLINNNKEKPFFNLYCNCSMQILNKLMNFLIKDDLKNKISTVEYSNLDNYKSNMDRKIKSLNSLIIDYLDYSLFEDLTNITHILVYNVESMDKSFMDFLKSKQIKHIEIVGQKDLYSSFNKNKKNLKTFKNMKTMVFRKGNDVNFVFNN